MKNQLILLIIAAGCMAFTFYPLVPQQTSSFEPVNTGIVIVIDSTGNEIYLAYQNGQPAYYYSNIFTPVCNTGECLPVFINIYWNLAGRYQKFDLPEGQILTKLDHVPFTEEDYRLLHDVILGPDPRFDDVVKHSSPGPGGQGDVSRTERQSEANPAPEMMSRKMVTKYEMVDGITGATAIQHRAKFVPGALYTTYTIWGLANDHAGKMMEYTRKNLLVAKNYNALITNYSLGCQQMVIDNFYYGKTEINARPNILMSVLDTANADVSIVLLNHIWYNEYTIDTVIHTLERKFYSTANPMLQNRILYNWTYVGMSDATMIKLAANMHLFPNVFNEMINLYTYRYYWPEGVLDALLEQAGKQEGEKRKQILLLLDSRKASYSASDWEKIKVANKKYKT